MKNIFTTKALIAFTSVFGLLFYLAWAGFAIGDTRFDDAFMIARYAKHWLAGHGFSWNLSDGPSYGVTSPAYLYLVTFLMWITKAPDALLLSLTSFTCGLLTVGILVYLGFWIQTAPWREKSWLPLLVVPAMVLMPSFRVHSLSGMETTFGLLALSLHAFCMLAASRSPTTRNLAFCLATGFLSYSIRPDAGLYALAMPPLFFVATDRGNLKFAIRYALILVGVMACGLLVNKSLFGNPLPLPFFAKKAGFYQGYVGMGKWNAMKEMLIFFSSALPFLLAVIASASRKHALQLLAIAVPIFLTFLYFSRVTQVMGWDARYYYPSLVLVVVAAYITLLTAQPEPKPATNLESMAPRYLAALVLLIPLISVPLRDKAIEVWADKVIGHPQAVEATTQYQQPANLPPKLGWWESISGFRDLLARLPGDAVVAASEYGYIGAEFPEMTIVDMVGLHDPKVAFNGFSAEYLLSREPDVIWFPHKDYTHAVAQIEDSPAFRDSFEYFPMAFDYGIAVNKQSPRYQAVKTAAREQFTESYGAGLDDYLAAPVGN